jgi:hypothetical protein
VELTAAFVAGFRSAKTRSNYAANLRDWFAWTEDTGTEPCQAQRPISKRASPGSRTPVMRPTRSASASPPCRASPRWAVVEDHVTRNPVEGARRARKPAESTAQGLSHHEMTDWLDAAEARGGSVYACACLLALNGLRVGESGGS